MARTIKEVLEGILKKPMAEICEIITNEQEPVVRRLAAQRIYLASQRDDPRSDKAFDQVFDRSEGKPGQAHQIEVTQLGDPRAILENLRREIGNDEAEILDAEIGTQIEQLPQEETPGEPSECPSSNQ